MQETLQYIKEAFELKNQGLYKQAIEMLFKALEEENDNTEILFQLGELYFLLKNFSRSEHYLEKVLQKNPEHIEALKILEQIYLYSNNVSDALLMAEKIYKIKSDEENLLKLINILSKKGSIKRLEEFKDTDSDKVLYAISKAFYDNKLMKESETVLHEALKKNPENSDALVLLGKIYFDKNEFDKSREIFQSFSKTSENSEILNYLGLFALEDMKFTDAIKYFSKASNIDKKNPKYFYNLANAYFYNGWIKESVASYMQAIRMEPDNLGFRYSLAYLYFEVENFDKAQKETDYILENDENYASAHVLNALLKLRNKNFLGAEQELETNLKCGNDDNFTLVSLAKVYSELAKFEKAEELMKKVLERNSDSLNYKLKLAEIYIKEGKFNDALDVASSVIEADENYIKAYIVGADAAYGINDLERTKEFAQNAISLDINYSEGYFYLALVRFDEKDFDEALECMKRAIIHDVENDSYYAWMSKIYEAKGDLINALEYMKEAESIAQNAEYKAECKRLMKLKETKIKI